MKLMKRLKRLNSNSGFTVVEMLAATAIAGILIVLVMSFTVDAFVRISVDSAQSDMLSDAHLGLDAITNDIRLSAAADTANRWEDANSPGAPGDPYSWVSDTDTIVLATAATDSNRNILFDDALHYISSKNNNVYFVSNGTLYKRTLAAPVVDNEAKTSCPKDVATTACPADRALINNVTNFSVRYINGNDQDVTPDNARSIELSVSMRQTKYGETISADYVTRTVFRNE